MHADRILNFFRLPTGHFLHTGLPTLDLGIPGLPALPFPPLPSIPSPPSFPLLLPLSPSLSPAPGGPHPLNKLGVLGERCKLPQWGLGRSPSQQTIWYIFEPKGAVLVTWWQQFLCIFLRINLNFSTNTRLKSSRV